VQLHVEVKVQHLQLDVEVKVQFALEGATKPQRERRAIALFFL
jgi:hypothetical protein